MLPPANRLQGAQLHRYVRDELYWSLHAPRQTGKTTFLQSWTKDLNDTGKYAACCVTIEIGQGATLEMGMPAICSTIRKIADDSHLPVPETNEVNPLTMCNSLLTDWAAKTAPKPLVVLFDEVDVLEGETMISFLRQLRSGFSDRGVGKFPVSIALVGMHDLKDWLISVKNGKMVNPGSPFNIKERSVTISNFVKEDIGDLFAQRTEETSQQIEPAALDYVWEQSKGQPWIVNNLFKRATMEILDEEDYQTVTLAHIQQAREQMIPDRETHLEALSFRLKDPNIRYVMETLITGNIDMDLANSDAFRQCLDLGLVANKDGEVSIVNPIYREVLAREISYGAQIMMPNLAFRWQKSDGTLDMDALLKEFQKFWRKHSEVWESKSDHTEAFPHLLLMAFLRRITNGEGRIDREYAAGRGRLDLSVEYANKEYIIEVKLVHDYDTLKEVKEEGIEQIISYRGKFDKTIPCFLVIFDRRSVGKKLPWEERISWNVEGDVTVIGC
ncbi:MAG: PD-(D/E)XK nuclease domain-containing protein [Planctomycetaceae bacterium]|jgi:ASC-1-like (ASCH) protein|nr:PD-(D/E)XK nuclease domain-containing protein [Planctomycetaceae bacterium]